jgi:hypothetical protein
VANTSSRAPMSPAFFCARLLSHPTLSPARDVVRGLTKAPPATIIRT